jgi:3-ketosteroid 9alpha-monooxygenase subunit A
MSAAAAKFPKGWFAVAFSGELAPGAVQPMRWFGRRFVAFRGESGKLAILDAYCPHLGADLGVGGKVVGDSVRCPFHAWRYGLDGRCVEVPYAKKIPPRACVTSWPIEEKNGIVFLWHDPFGGPPTWQVPAIPEYGSPDWTGWHASTLVVRTQPREIVENVADRAHFAVVHGTEVERFENEFIGHLAIQRSEGVAYPRGGGKDRFKLVATYYGPAYQITEMDSVLPNRLLNAHTPIDEHSVCLRFGVMLRIAGDAARTAGFAARYVENLAVGYREDVAIWENKLWREAPALADGDGPIGKLRRWYRQFYLPDGAAGASGAEPAPVAEA